MLTDRTADRYLLFTANIKKISTHAIYAFLTVLQRVILAMYTEHSLAVKALFSSKFTFQHIRDPNTIKIKKIDAIGKMMTTCLNY